MNEPDPTPKANLCSEIPCAEYRDEIECRVQRLENENLTLKLAEQGWKHALTEVVEALENCDRHVGLLGGERCKLERAQKLLGRAPAQR